VAEAYCNTVPNSTLNRDQHPPVAEVVKAIEWDPGNAAYWYKLAEAMEAESGGEVNRYPLLVNGEGEEEAQSEEEFSVIGYQLSQDGEGSRLTDNDSRLTNNAAKRLALERAVRLNPFDAQYHLQLGWIYAHQWQEPDYHTRWLPAADISMDRAAYFAGVKNPHLHQELGNYWTMRSKTVYPSDPLHQEAWAKGCGHYHTALAIEGAGQSRKGKAVERMEKQIRDYVWNLYPDEAFVAEALTPGP
jgi:hypothetical protein